MQETTELVCEFEGASSRQVKLHEFKEPSSEVKTCRGAVMPEFALVALVFIVFIFILIEVSRLLAVQAALTKGAQDAVVLASKISDIERDPATFTCTSGVPNEAYSQYQKARARVIDEALAFPRAVLVAPSGSSAAQSFHAFQFSSSCGTETADAVLLRPNDKDSIIDVTQGGDPVTYPNFGTVVTSGNYESILREFPLCVETRAAVRLIGGIAGDYTLRGRACSYREPSFNSSLPASLPPQPTTTTTTTTTKTTTTTTTKPKPTTTSTLSTSTSSTGQTVTSSTATSTTGVTASSSTTQPSGTTTMSTSATGPTTTTTTGVTASSSTGGTTSTTKGTVATTTTVQTTTTTVTTTTTTTTTLPPCPPGELVDTPMNDTLQCIIHCDGLATALAGSYPGCIKCKCQAG